MYKVFFFKFFHKYANFFHEIYHQKKRDLNIYFQQCVDEEDRIRTDLKICKSISIYGNQLHQINLPSNALNFAITTWNWIKTTTKKSEFSRAFQRYPNQTNLTIIEFKLLENNTVHLGLGLKWKVVAKDIEANESLD